MQWIQLLACGLLTLWAAQKPQRARTWAWGISAGLLLSMGMQMVLLGEVGKLTVNTAAPLHLCSMMGLLSIPMVLLRRRWLYSFSMLLGMPCALLALLFPAIAACQRPALMAFAFYQLHVLIVCAPLLLLFQGFPLSLNPRPVFLAANGYMVVVSLFNRLFHTNYLFLRLAPPGTPLEWISVHGALGYVLSLEMIAILALTFLSALYALIPARALSSFSSPGQRS